MALFGRRNANQATPAPQAVITDIHYCQGILDSPHRCVRGEDDICKYCGKEVPKPKPRRFIWFAYAYIHMHDANTRSLNWAKRKLKLKSKKDADPPSPYADCWDSSERLNNFLRPNERRTSSSVRDFLARGGIPGQIPHRESVHHATLRANGPALLSSEPGQQTESSTLFGTALTRQTANIQGPQVSRQEPGFFDYVHAFHGPNIAGASKHPPKYSEIEQVNQQYSSRDPLQNYSQFHKACKRRGLAGPAGSHYTLRGLLRFEPRNDAVTRCANNLAIPAPKSIRRPVVDLLSPADAQQVHEYHKNMVAGIRAQQRHLYPRGSADNVMAADFIHGMQKEKSVKRSPQFPEGKVGEAAGYAREESVPYFDPMV